MRANVWAACMSFAMFIWVWGGSASAVEHASSLPENPIGGSTVFVAKRCIQCHAILGSGGTVGPDLGRLHFQGGYLGMAGIMWNHAPKMVAALAKENIPLPRVNTKEMRQLVSFLYTLNYLDRPGDATRGEEVFALKRCILCHSLSGEGGDVGPPLDKYGSYISPLFVATGLWNKGPAMAAAMKRKKIQRPRLSGKDVRDIVAYIRNRTKHLPGMGSRVFIRPGNPRTGASLFKSKGCAGCHALYNKETVSEAPKFIDRRFKVSLSVIASKMWNHSPKMWALWKRKGLEPISLTVEEMADLTAYLYFLQFESSPGNKARGAVLFRSRGCAGCHWQRKETATTGPDLRTRGPWKSDLDLTREMWNHAGKMYGKMLSSGYRWPRLGEKEVADLLAYVRSIGGTQAKKRKK